LPTTQHVLEPERHAGEPVSHLAGHEFETAQGGLVVEQDARGGEVTKGEDTELLSENESTYIPIGKPHRLTNPGKILAFLIEVQSGPYLDENDIVRFEDIYHRDPNET
jgi:hypothetical protein